MRNTAAIPGHPTIKVSARQEMDAFDRLPHAVRSALANARYHFSAVPFVNAGIPDCAMVSIIERKDAEISAKMRA